MSNNTAPLPYALSENQADVLHELASLPLQSTVAPATIADIGVRIGRRRYPWTTMALLRQKGLVEFWPENAIRGDEASPQGVYAYATEKGIEAAEEVAKALIAA